MITWQALKVYYSSQHCHIIMVALDFPKVIRYADRENRRKKERYILGGEISVSPISSSPFWPFLHSTFILKLKNATLSFSISDLQTIASVDQIKELLKMEKNTLENKVEEMKLDIKNMVKLRQILIYFFIAIFCDSLFLEKIVNCFLNF